MPQIFAAVDYYFARKAENPTANITFTGHSLGGGLASLMTVYFDKQATVFDEAPFQLAAVNPLVTDAVGAYMITKGYVDGNFADYLLSASALALSREANVTHYYVEGEALDYPRYPFDTLVGNEYFFQRGNSTAGGVDLHSMALMTAMQYSTAFHDAVKQIPNLVTLLLDNDNFAADPRDQIKVDLLRKLLRHQFGVSGAITPDGMLDRFVADLQKITPTTYGMASDAAIAEALTVASMEYFYKLANANAQLFTFDSYGLHFKYSDIGASSYKSLPKLVDAVNVFLIPEEKTLLNGRLVKQDAWHIQSGTGGMTIHAGADNDAMIGGTNSDGLWGGAGIDILIGGANNDVLVGESGNDYLLGGIGNDTYILNPGDGYDTIIDTDGLGVIILDAIQAKGSTGVASDKWYQLDADNWIDAQNRITYSRINVAGNTQLFIRKGDSNVLVKSWAEGELGIVLGAGSAPPAPPSILTGTTTLNYLAAAPDGQRVEGLAGADMILGSALADHLLGGDGADWIEGDGGADTLEGGLGNDYISGIDSNSQAYGGDGNDLITAALAEGFQFVNIGNIPGLTADILWADAQSGFGSSINLIYNSVGNLDLQHGFVPLAPFGGASALGGGWSFSMDFGGGVWAVSYTHPTLAPGGKSPTGSWEHFIVPVTNAEGVFLFGEAGDDALVGNAGADYLDGDAGADRLFGHTGNDVLDGGTQNDLLAGGDGQDILLGGGDNDELYGEQQDDILMGGSGDDVLWGDSPNALLAAGDGADYLDGGDGNDQLAGGGGDDTLLGGAGIDLLLGDAGNDTLDGGAGIDTLLGGAGDDTYLNVTGEDVINDSEGNNIIVLASANGLAAGTALSITDSTTLKVALDTGETLTLQNAPFGMNATLQFANGDALDLETLVGTTLATPLYLTLDNSGGRVYGGAGWDILKGGSGNDTLAGHRGNDTLQGGAGNDVYLFSAGDGEELIFETAGNADVLRFGEGILPGEVKLVRWFGWDYAGRVEDSLRLERMNTTGTPKLEHVHIKGYFESADDSKRVDRIEFANGMTWTYADIQARLLVPSEKADWLNGYAGVDVIDGLGGDDGINGKAGDDTLQGGAGEDDLQGGLGNDTLLGGAGNDKLFGYGTWLDDSSAANNDTGNDVLNGGAGNDRLFGGKGNDIYLFGRGEGFDEVNEIPDTSGPTLDVLRLGTGVLPEHVTLHRLYDQFGVGDDLLVALDGSNTQIIIKRYFATDDRQIERIEFDGGAGAVWTPADILARVQVGTQNAMAGTAGDDIFVIDHELDSITEAANAGTDTIFASRSFWPLPANVENLTLTGFLNINAYGNALDNVLRGNTGNNYLIGNGGFDTAYGGLGDDTYRDVDQIIELAGEGIDTLVSAEGGVLPAQVENLFMHGLNVTRYYGASAVGNDLDNILTSTGQGIATDFLDGGIGADTMIIKGPDKVVVYIDNLGDKVIGTPYEVRSSIDYALAEPLLNDINTYVPNSATTRLALVGNGAIKGVGNALNNNLTSTENTAANVLTGGRGDDYYQLGIGDVAIELAGEGYDTVEISAAFGVNLPPIYYDAVANIEKVILTGSQRGTVIGSAQDDYIIGNGGSNTLWGNAGNDRLVGSNNNDTLIGGAGNDLYEAGWGDIIMENPNEGYDTVGFSYNPQYGSNSLAENIEEAYSRGIHVRIVGNSGNNIIKGDVGKNLLNGGGGDDLLDGGLGIDTLFGETGNDTYVVDDPGDVVTETSTLATEIDTVLSSVMYSLGANVENLTLTGIAAINGTGNALANIVTGNGASNTLAGGAGDDILQSGTTGTPVGTTLGSLVIYARGTPVLDVYPTMQVYVDGLLIQEFAVDATSYTAYTVDPTKLGTAAGKVDVVFTNDAYRPDIGQDRNLYVQKIEVNGQAMNATDNGVFYDPGSGAAAFDGFNLRLGQETLGSNGALRFTLGDNDTLDGGAGADQMSGGNGNDTYSVDSISDVVTEMQNEGTDTVRSSISYILGADLENLVLTGTAAINGTGNTLNNLLMGNAGNNILYGGAGADTLIGGAGNDRLDGGAGNDILQGGLGNDTYVVERTGDSVGENANQGRDTVESSISYTLGANVESLTLTGAAALNGTGNELDNTLTGNSANNVLTGGAGNDTLDGGAGADIMAGGLGNDYYVVDDAGDIVTEKAGEGTADSIALYLAADYTLGADIENVSRYSSGNWTTTGNAADNYLYGNSGNDTLIGLAGNDVLWGGAGADTLIGGVGNDRYYVDDADDIIIENANEGADTVYLFGSGPLSYTLGANVENGYSPFWAVSLTGNVLNNMLSGSYGADTLDGGLGADTLNGWGGNDTYIVDNVGDVVSETSTLATEIDTVLSSVTYTLGANVENLTLTGSAAINGTGNELGNVLTGNGMANVLDGGLGADTLVGGLGNDTYVVGRGYGMDTVVDNDATAGNADVAQFLSGVAADQIWFQQVGNNLEASIIGTTDKLVISDWYLGSASQVEEFQTTDGAMTLIDSNVQNLVNAMASFAPPAAGQTTLPQNYQDALGGVIAANWQ